MYRDCLACSTSAGKRRHFVVPTGIRVQLCHRLTAPTQHDLATSPEKTILYPVGGTDEGQAFFMLRGAPKGHDSSVAHFAHVVVKEWLPLSGGRLGSQGVEQFGRSEALFPSLNHHLFFPDHVHEFNTGQRPLGGAKRFEP